MATGLITLDQLNRCSDLEFKTILGPVFENAPWVCEDVHKERPFVSLTALHASMLGKLAALPDDRLLSFLRGHPPLSAETLRHGTTPESTQEQKAAGLDHLDDAMAKRLDTLNEAYTARFGFPFILAVRRASLATLLASFERRLRSTVDMERKEALAEISAISWMRLLDRIRPGRAGGLSTHVLDTVRARPAAGVNVELWRLSSSGVENLGSYRTDENGRCDVEESEISPMCASSYEWHYDTSTYFAEQGYSTPSRSYLGKVRIAFNVWNPEEHYHVPLLLNPGSYTTYRGN